MTITVTGATGHLGRLVLAELRQAGRSDVVAAVRDTTQDLGVPARHTDYDRPETLDFTGTDALLLISASELGKRAPQHRAVVDAAVKAGVGLIVYTSITRADTSAIPIAPEHKLTEEYIQASGLPFVFLRNNWYIENYTGNLASTIEHGVLLGAAGEGRIAGATRADFAAAAAAVLTGEGHANKTYELGGDHAFTLAEVAAAISAHAGREVVYRDLPEADYAQALTGFGVPEGFAKALAGSDAAIVEGALDVVTGDLSRLIGRPTTTLEEAIQKA
ncbi:SDR family oxidoreductase [Dactylosporangium sp. AC04546]|uniref:SDR family oxidoreductase n=1 Tax=Dactylosporangium sp. AC04546 TaxID=2862460 RepID=UPI001EDD9F68|nr:SDR family oxidoreductase [Dactylosporangium sp. AC04546]WVK83504.1 SDR family oxidoreductase [Dactylosporangium sp. AC04546]